MSRFWLKWGVYQHQRMRHCGGMAFSFIFSLFSQFLAKYGCFWKWNWSQECSIFQSAIEMSRFWLKWGVCQHQRMRHCGGMAFSLIFSHFSQFLAKNGWFWKRSWSQEFSRFQLSIEMYRLWLKWGVNQFLVMYICWDIRFLFISTFLQHWPPYLPLSNEGHALNFWLFFKIPTE